MKFKSTLYFIISIFIITTNVFSGSNDSQGLDHFEKSGPLIKKLLENQERVELHFYWTTPRVREELSDTNTSPIQVGGEAYAEKFPPYLNALLTYSSQNLHIRFVCDFLTHSTNQEWISALQEQHGPRFETVDIQTVHQRLSRELPDHGGMLQDIFRNATEGNPVIASDVYRLIGMPFANLEEPLQTKTQYTYCDIDTFCEGMERPDGRHWIELNGHTNLLKALLSKAQPQKNSIFHDPTTAFYLGRRDDDQGITNELIKLKIFCKDAYKVFCEEVLKNINDLDKNYKRESKLGHLQYFHELYNFIQQSKNDPEQFDVYLEEMEKSPLRLKDIIGVTGPRLTRILTECSPLSHPFPMISAWSWHGSQAIELGVAQAFFFYVKPSDEHQFEKLLTQYTGRLKDAFYVRKFGEDHPFNVKMRQYLRDCFPYHQPLFRQILESAWEQEDKESNPSFPEWAQEKIKEINTENKADFCNSPYAYRLIHVLKDLGIEITFEKAPEL